ncbi:uncharacterized protein LOC141857457 [Brevipalpus obovatus]|uniref:uncharacterized protein LOC141857457 n=1 Tax=Brevipalpus obovatus TaxID=246614 RepID=UPI003D9DF663
MNGNKIMHMQLGNISSVDSLLFFGESLASLPKAFGNGNQVVKGFFPHQFNKPENWMYVGPFPDKKYYQPGMMKSESLSEFEPWYTEMIEKNEIFDFRRDIIKYCVNDVEILATCCLIFRAKFLAMNGLDPLSRCFTIAQVGLELLRGLYLESNTLAISPIKGYSNVRKCSRKALAWLDYQSRSLKTEIIREYRIGRYYADGLSKDLNCVFEFLGCHFHGCSCCYPDDRDDQQTYLDDTLNVRYQKVNEKMQYYKSRNLSVISIWGCELKEKLSSDQEVSAYLPKRVKYWNMVYFHGHADIKESFYGGRTNNIKFFHKCDRVEEIKYMDVNSLYPFVLKNKQYPIGHPRVINENFDSTLQSYFGFIKCRILPPGDLYIPILPTRVNKKLIFTLCRMCCELQQSTCCHNEKERSLIETWTSVEVQTAIKYGYKVLDIIEVFHYEEKSDKIFKGYINKFLKIKHEASGWPQWCVDEVPKTFYLQQVKDRKGIKLDSDNIRKNPALRFIAKLLLNSLWGKLAQNPDKKRVEIIHNYDSYWKKLTDDEIKIVSEVMINDNTLLLQWKNREESLDYGPNTSLAVASFVTSYARLELFEKMDKIESIRPGSLIYFDTDSPIYYHKWSDPEIECGDHLWQLKDEIKSDYGQGAFIEEFATCGPKNYAYKVRLPSNEIKTTIKTKGITLNQATLQLIDYEFMLDATKKYSSNEPEERSIKVPQFNILTGSLHNVLTRYFSKSYRVVPKKRIVYQNNTYPYGFTGDRSKYFDSS